MNSIPKHFLDGDLCTKISLISIFSLFQVFNYDFIIYINFTRIAAYNTTSDDVTSWRTEHLLQTYYILLFILYSKLLKNLASLAIFDTIYLRFLIVAYFLNHPVLCHVQFRQSLRTADNLFEVFSRNRYFVSIRAYTYSIIAKRQRSLVVRAMGLQFAEPRWQLIDGVSNPREFLINGAHHVMCYESAASRHLNNSFVLRRL